MHSEEEFNRRIEYPGISEPFMSQQLSPGTSWAKLNLLSIIVFKYQKNNNSNINYDFFDQEVNDS